MEEYKTSLIYLHKTNVVMAHRKASIAHTTPAIIPALNSSVDCFRNCFCSSQFFCMCTSWGFEIKPSICLPVYGLTATAPSLTLYTVFVVMLGMEYWKLLVNV